MWIEGTEFNAGPVGITMGADGNLWFAGINASKISRKSSGSLVSHVDAAHALHGYLDFG